MVLEQTGGLAVFDVSNPSAPVRLAMVEGTADRGGFRIRGNRLVTARGSELRLYDLPPQGPPVLLGSVVRAPTLFGGVLDADGATVAVTDYSVKFGNSVAFYGIGDPAHPQELSRYPLADGMAPGSVKLSGQFAYVAASWDGVQILDLRDPKKPVLAAHLALAGREFTEASGIAVRETQLFVATGNGGLVVYDVADPYHPRLAGRYQVPGGAADVALCDGGVCVAARECGLQVFSTFPLAADAPRRSRLSGSSDFKVSLSRSGLEGANPVVTAESATSLPAAVWEPVPPSWLQSDDAGWTIVAPTAAPPRFFRFRVEFP
jgi:hypothetical protein